MLKEIFHKMFEKIFSSNQKRSEEKFQLQSTLIEKIVIQGDLEIFFDGKELFLGDGLQDGFSGMKNV